MSKTTNKKQIDILLERMQAYPDIARGMFKGGKEELNRVWRSLEAELNSAGPPSKTIAGWKKVWCDQKKYIRQKAAQNVKHSKGTGGGANMQIKLSSTEEAIYDLIGMKESIEGVANTFGLGSYNTTSSLWSKEEQLLLGVEEEEVENNDESHKDAQQPPAKKIKRAKVDLVTEVSVGDALAEEIGVQKKLLEAVKELADNTKKNYRSIDVIYKLKKEELGEQKRHNIVIEKNRRLIEVENLKYDLMSI